jgi:hypothetical protein
MRLKHEFVTLHDTNEIIFPIEFKSPNSKDYSCEISQKCCSLNNFSTNIYDFIQKIIKIEFNGLKTQLDSLEFFHAYYLSDKIADELMINLIEKYERRENETIPMKVILPSKHKFWHEITIVEQDYNHLDNLIQLYKAFKCLCEKYFDKNNELSLVFKIFFYIIPESFQRPRISIHNSENVNTVLKSNFNLQKFFENSNTRTIQIDYLKARISYFGAFLQHL